MKSVPRIWGLGAVMTVLGAGVVAACTAEAGMGSDLGEEVADGSAQGASDATTDRSQKDGRASQVDSGRDVPSLPDVTVVPEEAGSDAGDANVAAEAGDARTDASDAAREAEAGSAPEGAPCGPDGARESRACGRCGQQSRVCLVVDADAGATWQPWGGCGAEDTSGCLPGEQATERCGYCGTVTKICQSNCRWASTTCQGEAQGPDRCTPGTQDYADQLSCSVGSGRTRDCPYPPADGGPGGCIWGPYSTNCVSKPPDFVVGPSNVVGETLIRSFRAPPPAPAPAKLPGLVGYTTNTYRLCADGGMSFKLVETAYRYMEIQNTTTKTVRLSVWASAAPDGGTGDTVMAWYQGATEPADRTACVSTNDDCLPPASAAYKTACVDRMAGLLYVASDAMSGVTIPPSSSVLVFHASYGTASPFVFSLNVRIEALN